MFFFGLPAILVAVYGWIFRILQTMSIKRALNKEIPYEISLKLDEKGSRGISYSSQIVFFQSLHYTCLSSAICPLQVPGKDIISKECADQLYLYLNSYNVGT